MTHSRSAARRRSNRRRHREERLWEAKVRRRERSRHRHRNRHRRQAWRRASLVLGLLGAGFGAFAVLLYLDIDRARDRLATARVSLQAAIADPNALRTDEGRAATGEKVTAAAQSVAAARDAARGSVPLSLTRWMPGLGGQRTGLLRLIDDAATATNAGLDLLVKLDSATARTQLVDGQVPLAGLRTFGVDMRSASGVVGGLVRGADGLWGPLGDARRTFDDVARSTASRLVGGADAVDAALPFMGANGDRRYFIAIQNNAEMRDQGMVLSYAIVRFQDGRLTFERNGSVAELALTRPAPAEIPAGTSEIFGDLHPTTLWHSVNATADFSWSGQAMQAMYEAATKQRVDGVIAIDVIGIQRLITAVGAVSVPGIAEPVGPENAPRVLLHDLYEGLPPSSDQTPRRELLSEVTKAVINRITAGTRDAVILGRELGNAAEGGHLRLWSATPAEEKVFVRTGLGGGPASISPDRTIHVAIQNRTATKLDYYVTSSVKVDVSLTRSGDARVRTTVTVENRAPVNGKPSYQLGPDQFMNGPGDYWAWVMQWGPAGSRTGAESVVESGLPLVHFVLPVGPGERKDVTFPETVIPNAVRDGKLQLRLVPQARLEPADLQVTLTAPGRRVASPLTWSGKWDRVVAPSWQLGG